MMYVGSKQKCLLDSNVLVTMYDYCSMFNPPHIWASDAGGGDSVSGCGGSSGGRGGGGV
jgi:hypothetical protein